VVAHWFTITCFFPPVVTVTCAAIAAAGPSFPLRVIPSQLFLLPPSFLSSAAVAFRSTF